MSIQSEREHSHFPMDDVSLAIARLLPPEPGTTIGEQVEHFRDELTDRERFVIARRFSGISASGSLLTRSTQTAIARELGVSRGTVSRTEKSILGKLGFLQDNF